MDCLGAQDHRALTVRAAVNLRTRELRHWPSFLIDLLPQGAARKRIERVSNGPRTDWALLGVGAVNPVGNLRVPPSEPRARGMHPGFELEEMVSRGDEFVEYAHELGATVAGATDTQGEAPKFWVVEDENGRWHPDSGALGFAVRRYRLLKFPVPEAGGAAGEILQHEALYQRVAQILGLRVTRELPQVVDGSLLITRKSQIEYAKLCEVAPRVLADIEAGKGSPTVETLEKLLRPFGYRVGIVAPSDDGDEVERPR